MKKYIKRIPGLEVIQRQFQERTALYWNNYAMVHLQKFELPWMPWTSSAIQPSSILIILNEVFIHQRRTILEFGAGISTMYLGEAARRCGGTLVSIEPDAAWLAKMDRQSREFGLSNHIQFVHSPIVSNMQNGISVEWFDESIINKSIGEVQFDLVLIDSPISKQGYEDIRKPAGIWLQKRLRDEFCVFLDDINRKGEKDIANSWASEFNWDYKSLWPRAGVGIFRPTGCNPYNIC